MLCRLKGRLGEYKMRKLVELNDDDWSDKYKPMVNHINPDNDIQFNDWHMDEELNYLRLMDKEMRVWTFFSGDEGANTAGEGIHFVNRLHYFVCEVPYDPDTDYVVEFPDLW